MDLREAVGKLKELRDSYSDNDPCKHDAMAQVFEILNAVEGAWVDVDGGNGICRILIDGKCKVLGRDCVCHEFIADDPRCPAVILKEG